MADVSAFNGAERPRVNWGKWTLIAIGALFSVLLLVVPMMSIFAEAFSKGSARCGATCSIQTCCTPFG